MPPRPAKLTARTSTTYVLPCSRLDTRLGGRVTLTSRAVASIVGDSHKAASLPEPDTVTVYSRTPLHGSAKPAQWMASCALREAKATVSPASLTNDAEPPEGPEQHSLAAADATVCCSPAQLVARTVM